MNRYSCTAFVGRAGSGKTSSAVAFLTNSELFRGVFTRIFIVMPRTSRASMENDPFASLPEERLFDALTLGVLEEVETEAKHQAELGPHGHTLLLMDDVQSALKVPAIERKLVHLNSNRRHMHLCIWILAQNVTKIPKQLRMGITNLFLFSVSKADKARIHEELLEISEPLFERVCRLFQQRAKPHSFLYWCAEQRFFLNYDELELPTDDPGVADKERNDDASDSDSS